MDTDQIHLDFSRSGPLTGTVNPSGSKSISNRLLIIEKLSGNKILLSNISKANDTILLSELLKSDAEILDCQSAGTTFRFLTAYLALKNEYRILTGDQRMQKRPIGPLVDALNYLGANVSYKSQQGYPPLIFNKGKSEWNREVTISANKSSQFISALLLIAPYLENGLIINLENELVSETYIQMTCDIMKQAGISLKYNANQVIINPGKYSLTDYMIESDWSSASYFYGFVALKPGSEIQIKGLKGDSIQGDSIISEWVKVLGVQTEYTEEGAIVRSVELPKPKELQYDFIKCPDLFQTISVLLAALGIKGIYKGLTTLAIKETDRIAAIKTELQKTGIQFTIGSNGELIQQGQAIVDKQEFNTYNDHRMAMSLSLLSTSGPITIKDPFVVNKSNPNYWKDLNTLTHNQLNSN